MTTPEVGVVFITPTGVRAWAYLTTFEGGPDPLLDAPCDKCGRNDDDGKLPEGWINMNTARLLCQDCFDSEGHDSTEEEVPNDELLGDSDDMLTIMQGHASGKE